VSVWPRANGKGADPWQRWEAEAGAATHLGRLGALIAALAAQLGLFRLLLVRRGAPLQALRGHGVGVSVICFAENNTSCFCSHAAKFRTLPLSPLGRLGLSASPLFSHISLLRPAVLGKRGGMRLPSVPSLLGPPSAQGLITLSSPEIGTGPPSMPGRVLYPYLLW
jgi:hypothetical protein